MSRTYTVHLFRSGRVWVQLGEHTPSRDVDPPLLSETVLASTETAALGQLLLRYVDRANQPQQHVCAPCAEPCCDVDCVCGEPSSAHWQGMSQPHPFTPLRAVPQPAPKHHPHAACTACIYPRVGLAHDHAPCEACRS